MTDFEPILLANIDREESHRRHDYEATGGYQALRHAVAQSPADVIDNVKESVLRGRGGAGFPTGLKWTFLPQDHTGPIYFCLNADESEPGTFNNRILMEEDPHQVLEGLIISCFATRATTAYIYLRYEYPRSWDRLQQAIDECYQAGYLGKNILGSEFSLDVYLHRGAAAYICGEETRLIESIEGKRAWPRIKPPFPAVQGVFRKPTVVNNVETAACVKHIIDRGAEWFKSLGTPPDPDNPRDPGSFGPKLYCLSGHVNKPGCYEAPLGITARELIEEHGGGVWKNRRAKAVIPGGVSMGVLAADELDCPLDFSGPGRYGCLGLGTAAVVVADDSTSMVDFLHNIARFFAHESCGQCTPCREGTGWMYRVLDRMARGEAEKREIDMLLEVTYQIEGHTICALGDAAAWPVQGLITHFRHVIEERIDQYSANPNPQGAVREPVAAE